MAMTILPLVFIDIVAFDFCILIMTKMMNESKLRSILIMFTGHG